MAATIDAIDNDACGLVARRWRSARFVDRAHIVIIPTIRIQSCVSRIYYGLIIIGFASGGGVASGRRSLSVQYQLVCALGTSIA